MEQDPDEYNVTLHWESNLKAVSMYCVQKSPWWVSVPGGAGGHFITVVLGKHFEELVEENRKEANDHMNLLHTQEALRRQKKKSWQINMAWFLLK